MTAAGAKSDRKLISIVVPVYNEEGNILPLYEAVNRVFEGLGRGYDHEFVFTDNHSSDRTAEELTALAARDPRVRVFRFSRNFGFQRSIYTGYVLMRGDAAVQIDCDLQDPPEVIVDFIREWEAGHRVVFGIGVDPTEGVPTTRLRNLFQRIIDRLSEDQLPHDTGDFRLVDRRVIDVLRRLHHDRPYLRGTLATLGFDPKGVPYQRAGRTRGVSKFSRGDLLALAFDGILSHSTAPLRIATYTGLAVSVATLVGMVAYVVARFLFGADWPAGFATTTVLILLSLSINATLLGIIGEYVGRIYHQVRGRPLTVVEDDIDRAPPRGRAQPIDAIIFTRSVSAPVRDDGAKYDGDEAEGRRERPPSQR